jgi:hypothetical protein
MLGILPQFSRLRTSASQSMNAFPIQARIHEALCSPLFQASSLGSSR